MANENLAAIYKLRSQVLTATQAARILNYQQKHVDRLCREGKLEAQKTGSMWAISTDSVYDYKMRNNR